MHSSSPSLISQRLLILMAMVSFSGAAGFGAGQCSLTLIWFLCLMLVPVGVDRDSEVHLKAPLLWYATGLSKPSAPF